MLEYGQDVFELVMYVTGLGCEVSWDGVDFSPCFRDRYLANWQNFLVVVSILYLVPTRLYSLYRSRKYPPTRLKAEDLISPCSDSDLARLEAETILTSVASNLLPPQREKEEVRLSTDEAGKVIEECRTASNYVKSWNRGRRSVKVAGALIWFAAEASRLTIRGAWKNVPFPLLMILLAFFPTAPLTILLTLHLVPNLLILRSLLLASEAPMLVILPRVIEVVYWSAVVCIPYSEGLDRLLVGSRSHGGGSSGSFGSKLPDHIEEPTSAFGRATYTFIIPLLVRHYRSPINLDEIPAIREDDGAASSWGAFRADQAIRDERYKRKGGKGTRKRNLGWDLLMFFSPEIGAQIIWALIFICLQYLPPTGLRLLLRYISERYTSDRPLHVAYLYVAMMAGGQVIGVTAMGQSLVIGRRLCIRLRAIIIAEVFAKALRRQDSASVKQSANSDIQPKPNEKGKEANQASGQAESASEGKINNLVSVDAFQVAEICAYIFYLISCPFAVILNSVLLYNTLGVASFAGIAVLVALIPVQALVGRLFTLIQRRFMAAVDARLESVTEVIGHIKLIKFNAWEDKFFDRMSETRRHELAVLAQRFTTIVLSNLVIWGTPVVVTATAFAVNALVLKQPLTADRAFSSLILFNMLRDPLALFQDTLTRLLQSYTSCGRIQQYLEEPETLKYRQLTRPGPGDPTIGFRRAMVGYDCQSEVNDEDAEPFRLGELDLQFPLGQLSIITGPVGSGKSTLILSLLGETKVLQGQVFMPDDHANRDVCSVDPSTGLADTVAYCAQTPWLLGASIKENIVFGAIYDSKRYNAVVDACALRKDFEIFDLGDATEVGEKGTTCSGGQKARIALARALYSPAKTIILDDVISAVDAQTARHLHDKVLVGSLMKSRTCILVSHAVSLVVPSAAFVVVLEEGLVLASGTPSELTSNGLLDLGDEDSENASSGSGSGTKEPELGGDDPTAVTISDEEHETAAADQNLKGLEGEALETANPVTAHKDGEALETANPVTAHKVGDTALEKQLVQSESQSSGSTSLSTYLLYFRSQGGFLYWFAILTAFGGSQVAQVGTNAWVKEWTNSFDRLRAIADRLQAWAVQERSAQFYLGIYVLIAGIYLVAITLRVALNFWGSLRASRRLYERLLRRILGAKMRFFDSTPSGRIMNRLSKDMSSIDIETAEILQYFAQCCLSVAAVLIVVIFSTPLFVFALIGISVMYWVVGSLYVTTSREIKRYDSVTRSPIFISFSEVLVGMSTIRSYGDSARFMQKLFHELDQNTRCFWYLWQANRVLNNFSNFVGSLVTLFACWFALRSETMDAGAVGLSVSYALSFTEYVLWVVRLYAASEMSMNSVERVVEYLDLEVEEEEHAKGIEPPAYWPSREGSVVVEDLTCRYAPQIEPVLKGISFTIQPKEKIGICGRTGSGKSTLALSFFRFLHQSGGSIVIDGLDIGKISLSALRSRLTILPQEAQLFSGTVRDNLDPFAQHEDAEIWDALRQVGMSGKTPAPSRLNSRMGSHADLRATVARAKEQRQKSLRNLRAEAFKPTRRTAEIDDEEAAEERVIIRSLEEKVAVGGKNFSQGQRQLLALARGLLKLRSSNFLIMDESTANLDHATDMTIQNVLRTGLADKQMLVIAHRLLTVAGLDKILVLDHGKVVEFGTPWDLMQNEKGMFRELCRQSGEENLLHDMAKAVHDVKEGKL